MSWLNWCYTSLPMLVSSEAELPKTQCFLKCCGIFRQVAQIRSLTRSSSPSSPESTAEAEAEASSWLLHYVPFVLVIHCMLITHRVNTKVAARHCCQGYRTFVLPCGVESGYTVCRHVDSLHVRHANIQQNKSDIVDLLYLPDTPTSPVLQTVLPNHTPRCSTRPRRLMERYGNGLWYHRPEREDVWWLWTLDSLLLIIFSVPPSYVRLCNHIYI